MNYQITINTDNSAFCDGDLGSSAQYTGAEIETARILRKLADDIEGNGLCEFNLCDFNGNKVGEAGEVQEIRK